jgi:hypothetical protein
LLVQSKIITFNKDFLKSSIKLSREKIRKDKKPHLSKEETFSKL